jgi:WD40 repeat protein
MWGQAFVQIHNIESQGFPRITARFFAFDRDRNPISGLQSSDVKLSENGIPRPVTLLSCPTADSAPTTTAIMVDTYRHLGLATKAIQRLAYLTRMPPSRLGVTTMDNGVFILQDMTMDRSAVVKAANRVISTPSVHLHRIFYDNNAGGVPFISGRNGRKALILITDLHCPVFDLDTAQLWRDAARENIRVYTILVDANDYRNLFARISIKTGGMLYERVTTSDQIENVISEIAADLGSASCALEWTSDMDCNPTRVIDIAIPSYGINSRAEYIAPTDRSVPTLTANPRGVAFYNATVNADHDALVTVTATNRDIALYSVSSANDLFSIVCIDNPLPFILNKGKSTTFRITFHPIESEYTFGLLTIESDACTGNVLYATGIYGLNTDKTSLHIDVPNGGERLIGGDTATLKWSGVSPSERIDLEYSIDQGTTWSSITTEATGLSYNWPVPLTPSDKCLLRGIQRFRRPNSPDTFTIPVHGPLVSAQFSPDASTLLTCTGSNGTARLWDAYSGAYINWIHLRTAGRNAIYNTDGITMFCSTADSTVELVGIELSTPIRTYRGHSSIVQNMSLSPDGNRLATAGTDGTVIVFDVASEQVVLSFKPHPSKTTVVRFSPDGRSIATTGGDSMVVVSDATSGGRLLALQQPAMTNDLAFSPDGALLALAGNDYRVRLLNIPSGSLARTMSDHTDAITSVEFSPGGDLLLSTSKDNSARIWDVASGTMAKPTIYLNETIVDGHFDATGTRVALASLNYGLLIQRISPAPVYQSDISDDLWSILVPQLEVTTSRVDMGMAYVGSMIDSLVERVVCNRGEVPVHILGVDPTSGDVGDFMITSGAGDFILPPGECRAMVFAFTPTDTGMRQARFTLRTALDSLRDTLLVTGRGEESHLELFSSAIDFGRLNVGDTKDSTIDIMLHNTGTLPFTISEVAIGGPDTAQFAIISGGGSVALAPNASRPMQLRFSPMIVGKTSARVDVYYDGPGSPVNIPLFAEAVGPRLLPTATPLECIIPCRAFVDTTLNIYNNGNAPLLISSLELAGNDPDLFFITPDPKGVSQVTIPPGDHLALRVRYHPPSPGHHAAKLTFVSNAIDAPGGITVIPLIGEKDSTGFNLSRTTVAFTDIPKLTPERTSLTLTNTGTLPLVWSAPVNLGSFTIESITPSTTLPGETSEIVVTFAGGDEGYKFNTIYLLDAGACARVIPLGLSASVRTEPIITLATPDIVASPGDTIEIPIRLTNPGIVANSGVRSITTRLSFNASLLVPIGITPHGSVVDSLMLGGSTSGSRRVIPLELPIPISAEASIDLIRLPFIAVQGKETTTTLLLEGTELVGGSIAITLTPGHLTVTEQTGGNGTHKLQLSDDILLRPLRPMPVHTVAEVDFTLTEDGPTRLSIVNSAGEVVEVLTDEGYSAGAHSLTLNAAGLPSGFYICVLQTRSRRVMRPFVVE